MVKDRVQTAFLILVRMTGPGPRQCWCDEEERQQDRSRINTTALEVQGDGTKSKDRK